MEPDVAAAIAAARERVIAEPDASESWGELGAVLHAHNLWEPAIQSYERARELGPTEFRWTYLLAVAVEAEGEVERAEGLYERATAMRPGYGPAWLRLALARSRRGALASALAAAERAVTLAPQDAFALRTLGELALAAGETARAVTLLTRASVIDPDDGGTWSALARAHTRSGRPADAERASRRAQSSPGQAELDDPVLAQRVAAVGVSALHRLTRAQRLLGTGEVDRAIVELEALVELRPDDADVRYLMGVALARRGRTEAARLELERTLALAPDHVRAMLDLGRLAEMSGRPGEALTLYRRARVAAPRDPAPRLRLLETEGAVVDRAERVALYRELAEIAPGDPRVWVNLGTAELDHDPQAARDSFERAVRLAPDLVEARWGLALTLEQLGLAEAALEQFREVLRLDPRHETARQRLAARP
jgi:tetratricopeptide (TPR) repeat protein